MVEETPMGIVGDAQAEIQEMVSALLNLASGMLPQGGFQPIGASITNDGTFQVEYVPSGGGGMDSRKRLHRILVRTAKSGQARAVAICHSLENQMGSFLVLCADHVQAQPVTFLVPLSDTADGVRVSGKPMVQRAAYTFFKFIDPASADRLLPGRWFKESGGEDRPGEITYHTDRTYRAAGEQGQWRVEEGGFFTNLVEVPAERGAGRQRVSRMVSLDEHRLELNEVVGGLVVGVVYTRSQEGMDLPRERDGEAVSRPSEAGAGGLRQLVQRLTDPTRDSLEFAARICLDRKHYDLTLPHLLIALVEKEPEVRDALKAAGVDPFAVSAKAQDRLDGLARGSAGIPRFAPEVVVLLTEATKGRAGQVGGQDLLQTMLRVPDLRRLVCELVEELSTVSPEGKVDRAEPSRRLLEVLKRCCELSKASQDAVYSSRSISEIVAVLEGAIETIERGAELNRGELKLLFAPTGALQETSLENGWAEEYLSLSAKFDGLIG
jgi:hypothetical protein